jgi:hypothetical protein
VCVCVRVSLCAGFCLVSVTFFSRAFLAFLIKSLR